MRTASWLSTSLAIVLALAGCATVPTSGPVERHTPQAPGVNSGVHVDPLPPANGASQLLVVEGFLHAMGVYQPNYNVARQYLTEMASASWDPESGVEVYTESDQPVESEQGVALSYVQVGTVDASGIYRPDNTSKRYIFTLVKDSAGQWRIANPPPGLLVSRYMFTTNYTSVNLHFLSSAGDVLVPDPRFFALGDQAPAAVVRAQLDGPSAWLEPVVERMDTAGITLGDVSVDIEGLLEVKLGSGADALSAEQRRTLLAELAFTMTGLVPIQSLKVTSGGQAWRSEFGQTEVDPDSFARLSPENSSALRVLFTIRDDKLQRMRDPARWDDFVAVETALTGSEQVAVRSDLAEVAAVDQSGTRLQSAPIGSGKARVLRNGAGLLRPDYARNGELWSVADSGLASLRVFRENAGVKVDVGGLPAGRVVAAKLSPDGLRIAVALQHGSRTEVGLAVVVRDDAGVAVTGWRVLDATMNTGTPGQVLDLGW
ncbi:MAG: hypothetical protein IT193_01740, partial [Propionibacteriaceae bacterium]|nr:hypothetical protein [Propionibacteriaceae bacterium]